jgi:hypothetical protein
MILYELIMGRRKEVMASIGNRENPKRNAEGYLDPTAYEAIKNIDEEEARFHKLLNTIFYLCDLAGFRLEDRIVLTDKRTGKTWR